MRLNHVGRPKEQTKVPINVDDGCYAEKANVTTCCRGLHFLLIVFLENNFTNHQRYAPKYAKRVSILSLQPVLLRCEQVRGRSNEAASDHGEDKHDPTENFYQNASFVVLILLFLLTCTLFLPQVLVVRDL